METRDEIKFKGARLELKANFKNYEETYIMNRVRTTRFEIVRGRYEYTCLWKAIKAYPFRAPLRNFNC